jgi:hypothetical protein
MNARLIESTRRLIAILKSHALDMDNLADMSHAPEQSEYRRRAEASRSDAKVAEENLKGWKNPQKSM